MSQKTPITPTMYLEIPLNVDVLKKIDDTCNLKVIYDPDISLV
jgi:hypothetical protein